MIRLLGKNYFDLKFQLSNNRYPCVFKIGHAHGGTGKAKVENSSQFQVR